MNYFRYPLIFIFYRLIITAIAIVFAMTCLIVCCEKDKNSKSAIVKHESVSTQLDATEETDINLTASTEDLVSIKEQEEFGAYLQKSFEEAVTTDTIIFHLALTHQENYGITMDKVILDAGPCQFYILENIVEECVKDAK